MAALLVNFVLSVILGIVLRVFVSKKLGAAAAVIPPLAGGLLFQPGSVLMLGLYLAGALVAFLIVYLPRPGFFSIGRRNYNPEEMLIPEDYVNPIRPAHSMHGKPLLLIANPRDYIVVRYGTPPEIIDQILASYEQGVYRYEDFADYVIEN